MQGQSLNVQWKRNEFRTFYALMKIRIGGVNEGVIHEGDEFEFDGTVLKYSGSEFPQPSLRGAFRSGWVSEVAPGDGHIRVPSKQTTRNMARSQSVNRDLSNVSRTGPRQISASSLDEDTVLNVSDRNAVRQGERGHLTPENNRRGLNINRDEIDEQEGVSIGRVRTPARLTVADTTKSDRIANQLENLSGSGFIADHNSPVSEMRHKSRTIQKEGVTIKTSVGDIDRNVQLEANDEGVVIGKTRRTASSGGSGISVEDTSNIRSSREKSQSPQKTAYKVNTKLDPKVRIARAIDPTFPSDWVFSGKIADRLAAVKTHGPTPEFLEALYAAEGDQMRRALAKAYPKQFG